MRRRVVPSIPAVPAGLAALALACGGPSDRPAAGGTGASATGSAADSAAPAGAAGSGAAAARTDPACAPANGGLTLPTGFCATIFADSVGGGRHVAVAPNGDVFVSLMTAAKRGIESGQAHDGGILALRDRDGDGVADTSAYFGDLGGTGVAVAGGWVYADAKSRIVRWPVAAGQLRPTGPAQVIVEGMPTGGHEARNFALDGKGNLFVNIGSLTNSCQQKDRGNESPGVDPCTELETRAGVWRFAADRQNQRFSPSARFATGIRNAMGLTVNPANGLLYTTQHGRDQLLQNWASRGYTAQRSAELPAEEFMQVDEGDDFGWPYCYHDQTQEKRVLAPEYGGDGGTQVGRCAQKKAPLVAFPGHWAPMASLFYTGRQFPARYREGVFVSFHGSWNRAPLPQAGYRVAFATAPGGNFDGRYETFAGGFNGSETGDRRGQAAHRPVGLAQSRDGGLFVTDDAGGRIWKIVYTGQR
jgi:glucose/arabinose dehydrogenase